MNFTTKSKFTDQNLLVNTENLQKLLQCGRVTAIEIGAGAEARVQIGRRVLWNVEKVRKYLEYISE